MKTLLLPLILIIAVLALPFSFARAGSDAALSPYVVNVGPQLPGKVWNQPYEAIFTNAQDAGVRWGFIFVTWSDVQSVPGQIDLTGLDQVVISAHAHKINLILQVQSTGDWDVTTPAEALATGGYRTNTMHPLLSPKTAAPMNIDAALPLWQALLARYGRHGTLAAEQGWNGYGIENYEVENEPDFIPAPNGNWETVTKDYALYLSHVAPAAKAIDPSMKLLAPALSGVDSDTTGPIPNTGLTWLDTLLSSDPSTLSFASDQYRAAGLSAIGAGPFIDVYSFHCDFVDPTTNAHVVRAANVRQIIAKYASQPAYSTNPAAPAWCTEGSATTYDSSNRSQQFRFAWAQVQFAAEMMGGGVPRFNYDFGTEGSDAPATWSTDPIRGATLALTDFFPTPGGIVDISANLTALAGQTVIGYQRTDPTTGLKSTVMWAQDEAAGSGTSLPPFTVNFPVATAQAIIVDPHDWSRTTLTAANGTVAVPLNRDDPSPPYMVIESASGSN
jgi:hypothetical protein